MPILVTDAEKNFADVAARVLSGRASKAAHAEAISALRAANPGLDPERLRPGTVIVVPSLSGVRPKIEGSTDETLPEIIDRVRVTLADAGDALEQQAGNDQREREETLKVLGSSDIKEASARDPDLRVLMSDLAKSVRADAKAAEGEAARWRAAVEQWTADLDAAHRPR